MIDNLIKELKAAECGSAELDLKVMKVLGLVRDTDAIVHYVQKEDHLYVPGDMNLWSSCACLNSKGKPYNQFIAPLTRSLDATEDALPEGWYWEKMELDWADTPDAQWDVSVREYLVPPDGGSPLSKMCVHKSLPIARTIAVLKAHIEGLNHGA
jgi:hypothetical protein